MLQSAVSHLSLKRSRPDGPAKARFHQTWMSPMRPGNPRRKTLSGPAGFERFAVTGFRQCGSHHSRIFAPAGSLGRAPCPVSPGSLQDFPAHAHSAADMPVNGIWSLLEDGILVGWRLRPARVLRSDHGNHSDGATEWSCDLTLRDY